MLQNYGIFREYVAVAYDSSGKAVTLTWFAMDFEFTRVDAAE